MQKPKYHKRGKMSRSLEPLTPAKKDRILIKELEKIEINNMNHKENS